MKAAILTNDCLNNTATTAKLTTSRHTKLLFEKLPPANTFAFMQPALRRVHQTCNSEPKAKQCFYLNGGHKHLRECAKVLTSSGLESDTRDVTWEV